MASMTESGHLKQSDWSVGDGINDQIYVIDGYREN